ncbi:MAG: helix-turn-helix transcriptional regulator [Gemmatimonadetes bacterium]|nr:helix-turn-helix transcriptional regulator [Gemmatimonadota bacterium]
MARAATTSDVYNAIAEPRRRAIFEALCAEERAVTDLVEALGLDQPTVSKHLRVLREVGLVTVRQDGRRRIYTANPDGIRPVHAWVQQFERLWTTQIDAIQARAEAKAARDRSATSSREPSRKGRRK